MEPDKELERLMQKKYAEFMRRAEEKKKLNETQEKIRKEVKKEREAILKAILYPDAYPYLVNLRKRKPVIAKKIEDLILGLVLSRRLKTKVKLIDLEWLERKIAGIEPKILIKRGGEVKSLSEVLKEK
ncbi:MAG: hypothetical protein GTN80_02370 [Nitrososphaeria archaeon]|nr:hypothetical protein [Nitrososphaeria archaeon]NIN52021.1 hypothetical protein [Nitrososphaeria archaeon]NIQ32483.1 hypothetical protein [Nitrososphaeria archaeon]